MPQMPQMRSQTSGSRKSGFAYQSCSWRSLHLSHGVFDSLAGKLTYGHANPNGHDESPSPFLAFILRLEKSWQCEFGDFRAIYHGGAARVSQDLSHHGGELPRLLSAVAQATHQNLST